MSYVWGFLLAIVVVMAFMGVVGGGDGIVGYGGKALLRIGSWDEGSAGMFLVPTRTLKISGAVF